MEARVICATNCNLMELVKAAGTFRSDLYYRLNTIEIRLPALRERRDDIMLLAYSFLHSNAERHRRPAQRISTAALAALQEYDWPGNVRELKNVIERAAIMSEGDELNAIDIGDESTPKSSPQIAELSSNGNLVVPYTSDFRDDRREFERRYIARCLEESGGNVTRAASVLGMHRQSLQHKLRELGLGRRYVAVGNEMQEKSDK